MRSPNLIAFDICGVQPMTGPTGQVFALRAVYGKDPLASGAKEAFHPMFSPDSMYSGQGAAPSNGFTELASGTAIADGAIVFHDFGETGRVFLQNVSGSPVTVTGSTDDALDAAVIAEQEKGTLAEISYGMATSVAELQEQFNGSTGNRGTKWASVSISRLSKHVAAN
ncbi:major capsid protein [Klebsiella phage CPRSB]|nr:major capsid protein [Klebsiella phage CPRSB]